MKRYINDKGEFWDNSPIVLTDGEETLQVFNPSEGQLAAAGFHEYAEPEKSPSEILTEAKAAKMVEIERYDHSEAVNSFSIAGRPMWLGFEERARLLNQVQSYRKAGRTIMEKYYGGQPFTFPVDLWEQMLAKLEVYAGDALNVTERHKAEIQALESVEEVEAYDITEGYPPLLTLDIEEGLA